MDNLTTPQNKSSRLLSWVLIAFAILVVINGLAGNYLLYAIPALVKALVLLSVCLIYGILAQILLKCKRENISLGSTLASGLIVTSFFFFLLGFLQQLNILWFVVYIVLAIPAAAYVLHKHHLNPETSAKQTANSSNWLQRLGPFESLFSDLKELSPIIWVFLFPLFFATLPPSFFDTLVYHLGIPNLYIQNGGFFATPQFLYANTSTYYEISLVPSVFAGETVPRLFHFLIGMVLMLSLAEFARDFLGVKKRGLLLLLVVSMPMGCFLISTVKNDLTGALFILLAVRALLEKRYLGAGVFWGFAVGIKYFNALPLAVFLVLFLVFQKYENERFSALLKGFFLFAVSFVAILIPLLLKNIIYAGNPFYPFMGTLFPVEYWDTSRFKEMARDVGKVIRTWSDFLYLPYNLEFTENGFGGIVGVQFLAFLPLLILFRKKKSHLLLLTFSLLSIAVGCAFTGSIRFLFLPFLLLCIFVVWVFEQRPTKLLKFLLVIVLLLNAVYSITMLDYFYQPGSLYKQNYDLEEYKREKIHGYIAMDYLNTHSAEKSRILLVGETKNYYLKRPYTLSSAIDYSILKTYLEKAKNCEDWLELLKSDGFDYLLVNLPEFVRLNDHYKRLSKVLRQKAVSYFKELDPVFYEQGVYVFELK